MLLMEVVEEEWDSFQKREELDDLGGDDGSWACCLDQAAPTVVVALASTVVFV